VIDKAGAKAELFVDPTNGVIVSGGEAAGAAKGTEESSAEKDDD
jgi:hypothetical protein